MMHDSVGLVFPSVVMIVGLVIVLSGFFPRYTGILHAWVTLSMSPAISLPDGGEAVSQIVVVILAVVLLSDGRLNHWHATTSSGSPLLPVTWAASHLLRFQLIWVYLNAAISKTSVPEWKDGTAVYFITLDPMFGTSGPFGPIFDWLVNIPVFSLLMTWGGYSYRGCDSVALARLRPVAAGGVLVSCPSPWNVYRNDWVVVVCFCDDRRCARGNRTYIEALRYRLLELV